MIKINYFTFLNYSKCVCVLVYQSFENSFQVVCTLNCHPSIGASFFPFFWPTAARLEKAASNKKNQLFQQTVTLKSNGTLRWKFCCSWLKRLLLPRSFDLLRRHVLTNQQRCSPCQMQTNEALRIVAAPLFSSSFVDEHLQQQFVSRVCQAKDRKEREGKVEQNEPSDL